MFSLFVRGQGKMKVFFPTTTIISTGWKQSRTSRNFQATALNIDASIHVPKLSPTVANLAPKTTAMFWLTKTQTFTPNVQTTTPRRGRSSLHSSSSRPPPRESWRSAVCPVQLLSARLEHVWEMVPHPSHHCCQSTTRWSWAPKRRFVLSCVCVCASCGKINNSETRSSYPTGFAIISVIYPSNSPGERRPTHPAPNYFETTRPPPRPRTVRAKVPTQKKKIFWLLARKMGPKWDETDWQHLLRTTEISQNKQHGTIWECFPSERWSDLARIGRFGRWIFPSHSTKR